MQTLNELQVDEETDDIFCSEACGLNEDNPGMRGLNATSETTKPRIPGLCRGQLKGGVSFSKTSLAESESVKTRAKYSDSGDALAIPRLSPGNMASSGAPTRAPASVCTSAPGRHRAGQVGALGCASSLVRSRQPQHGPVPSTKRMLDNLLFVIQPRQIDGKRWINVAVVGQ